MGMGLCFEYDIEDKVMKDMGQWCYKDIKIGKYKRVRGNMMWEEIKYWLLYGLHVELDNEKCWETGIVINQ